MPKLQCLCKNVIDVSGKAETVECPVCGRRYRKPSRAEKHPKRAKYKYSTDFKEGTGRRHTGTPT